MCRLLHSYFLSLLPSVSCAPGEGGLEAHAQRRRALKVDEQARGYGGLSARAEQRQGSNVQDDSTCSALGLVYIRYSILKQKDHGTLKSASYLQPMAALCPARFCA